MMAVPAAMLILGEAAKMGLNLWFESKRLEGKTAQEIETEFKAELTAFRSKNPADIPDV